MDMKNNDKSKIIIKQLSFYFVLVVIVYFVLTFLINNWDTNYNRKKFNIKQTTLSQYTRIDDNNSNTYLAQFYLFGEKKEGVFGIEGENMIYYFDKDFSLNSTLYMRDCVIVIPEGVTVFLNNIYADNVAFVVAGKLEVKNDFYHDNFNFNESYRPLINGEIEFENGGEIQINNYFGEKLNIICYYNSIFEIEKFNYYVPMTNFECNLYLEDECDFSINNLTNVKKKDFIYHISSFAYFSRLSFNGESVDLSKFAPQKNNEFNYAILFRILISALLVGIIFCFYNFINMYISVARDMKKRDIIDSRSWLIKILLFWPLMVLKYIKYVQTYYKGNVLDASLKKIKLKYCMTAIFTGLIIFFIFVLVISTIISVL